MWVFVIPTNFEQLCCSPFPTKKKMCSLGGRTVPESSGISEQSKKLFICKCRIELAEKTPWITQELSQKQKIKLKKDYSLNEWTSLKTQMTFLFFPNEEYFYLSSELLQTLDLPSQQWQWKTGSLQYTFLPAGATKAFTLGF